MILKRSAILIILLVGVYSASVGQDVTVTAVFDSSRIYIGDQINYTVTIDQPADLVLEIPFFKDTLCKNIEIISGPVIDSTLAADNRLKITSKYFITSFDSGFYEVPPTFAEIKSESGIKRFYSEYSPLKVMRVKIAPADSTAKIFDIIGPYKAPVTLGEILPWILLAALVSAALWGIVRLLRRFKKHKKEPEIDIIPDPAHVIAFRDLEKLRNEQLWQKGQVKLYYSRLTEILRQYLENRYGVYSLEMTTSETLEVLLQTGFKKDNLYASLKTILNGSDLVKFAKYKPDSVENDVHFQNSWAFIEATMIKEIEPTPAVSNETTEKKP
jgi:hypothetical protein